MNTACPERAIVLLSIASCTVPLVAPRRVQVCISMLTESAIRCMREWFSHELLVGLSLVCVRGCVFDSAGIDDEDEDVEQTSSELGLLKDTGERDAAWRRIWSIAMALYTNDQG